VYFKVVQPGNGVSYGSTWAPDAQTRVVTVPVGYGDGYFRSMSGLAEVLIGGRRYPVVGRICMDQLMVDIGMDSAFNGDEVVLLREQAGEIRRADDLASWAGTIPYQVLTNINTRVPRVHVGAVEPSWAWRGRPHAPASPSPSAPWAGLSCAGGGPNEMRPAPPARCVQRRPEGQRRDGR